MSATYTTAGAGRHRAQTSSLVLPQPPNDEEKYLYIHRNLVFLATTMVIGASTVIISQVDFETHNPLPWPFVVFTVTFFAYQVISLPVNFTGSGFDLAAHRLRVRTWNPVWYPAWISTCRSAGSRSRCCATPGRPWRHWPRSTEVWPGPT